MVTEDPYLSIFLAIMYSKSQSPNPTLFITVQSFTFESFLFGRIQEARNLFLNIDINKQVDFDVTLQTNLNTFFNSYYHP